jgi:hypothetical protein
MGRDDCGVLAVALSYVPVLRRLARGSAWCLRQWAGMLPCSNEIMRRNADRCVVTTAPKASGLPRLQHG